jgi:hypothetical protein
LGSLEAIRVTDNGSGIIPAEAGSLFANLGGSWKRGTRRSKGEKRLLHGQEGKGRLRALSLGRVVDWLVVAPASTEPDAPLGYFPVKK